MTKMLPGWGSVGRREGGREGGRVRQRRRGPRAYAYHLTNNRNKDSKEYIPPCKNPSPKTIRLKASVKLASNRRENTAASGEPSAIPLSTIFSFNLVKGVPWIKSIT